MLDARIAAACLCLCLFAQGFLAGLSNAAEIAARLLHDLSIPLLCRSRSTIGPGPRYTASTRPARHIPLANCRLLHRRLKFRAAQESARREKMGLAL